MRAAWRRKLYSGLSALLGMVWVVALAANPAAAQTRILFINPATPDDQHWNIVTSMMRAAASDLGVQLDVEYAFHSGEFTLKHASVASQQALKPNYIIFRPVENTGPRVLQLTHAAGINTITIDSPFSKEERQVLGQPRQPYTTWLGQIVPNAIAASTQLGQLLAREVNRRNYQGVMEFVAITGPEEDVGSQMRLFGLRQGIQAVGNAKLLGSFSAKWSTRVADREAYKAFRYALESPVWWVADDNMTIGVLNVLRNTHRKIGTDTFIAAFHWTEQMMTALVQNRVQYVAGGHFIQGALALIMAHDHARGRDFADLGVNHTVELAVLHRENVANIGRIMISDAWDRIDFRRFSRVTNPNLAQYDMSVNNYLRAVLGQ